MQTLLQDDRIRGVGAALESANLSADRSQPLAPRGQAAVALVLRVGEELEFLLVRRAESERDPWSGHMAMPGGRREQNDPNLVATAIRETAEETHILLDSEWTLGRLDPVSPQSQRLPTLRVHPFVFAAPSDTTAIPEGSEIASVHWVPVSQLFDPDLHTTVEIPLIGTIREFPALKLGGHIVWGLTYRILRNFQETYANSRR